MEQPVARTPRPSMLAADEVAECLKIKKGGALRGHPPDEQGAGDPRARGDPRAHLAHQGEHHLEQAPAVLRRHAHVRHKARRHSQVAELPHGVHEARRRRLQAHVTEDHLCDADELDAGLQRQLSLVMEIFNGLGEAPPSGKRAASEKIWEAKHGQDR